MRHILIIEDQHMIAKSLNEIAILAGASSVTIADNAALAIAAATEHPPRIILSDIDLGPGGRGPDAVAAIQDAFGPIPAIFITAEPTDAAAQARASAILPKPVTAHRVRNTLVQVLASCPDPRFDFGRAAVSASLRLS